MYTKCNVPKTETKSVTEENQKQKKELDSQIVSKGAKPTSKGGYLMPLGVLLVLLVFVGIFSYYTIGEK